MSNWRNWANSVSAWGRNLAHPDEFVGIAQMASERSAAIQIDQINRTVEPQQNALQMEELAGRQPADCQIQIARRCSRITGAGTEDIDLPRARSL